ncbi:MAG: hypothetical protein WAL80_07005 [Xanthobacteraceae bacterium]
MSESLAQSMKPVRPGASDLQMLVQVEKWMAAIRELNSEPQNEAAFRVRLRPATASAKE